MLPYSERLFIQDNAAYTLRDVFGSMSWQIGENNGIEEKGTRLVITYWVPYR